MAKWITKLFEQLLVSLDDILDIVDLNGVLQTVTVFEQIQFTKKQLQDTRIMEFMNDLYEQTPNHYLKYRLESLLAGWRDIVHVVPTKKRKTQHPTSVFEAIIKDDDYFFETKSVPELLHRLLKSFDKNYKVTDMATVLNTIDTLEEINIPASQLAATHLVTYIRRMRRNTTNRFLSHRLRDLLKKWRDLLVHSGTSKRKVTGKKHHHHHRHHQQSCVPS